MTGISEEKRSWMKAVLDVVLSADDAAAPGGAPSERSSKRQAREPAGAPKTTAAVADISKQVVAAKAAWRTAIEDVDGQITDLQAAMRKYPDDDLHDIAEFGLNGVTGGNKVLLMAALVELGDGNALAVQKSGKQVLSAVAEFRTLINSDERVAVIDDNPFSVTVAIRETLGPALQGLENALKGVV